MFAQVGYGETALVFDGSVGPQAQEYEQSIYQFPSAHAASAIFAAMRVRSASCRSYTLPPVSGTREHARQSVPELHTGGHQAFLVTQSTTLINRR